MTSSRLSPSPSSGTDDDRAVSGPAAGREPWRSAAAAFRRTSAPPRVSHGERGAQGREGQSLPYTASPLRPVCEHGKAPPQASTLDLSPLVPLGCTAATLARRNPQSRVKHARCVRAQRTHRTRHPCPRSHTARARPRVPLTPYLLNFPPGQRA